MRTEHQGFPQRHHPHKHICSDCLKHLGTVHISQYYAQHHYVGDKCKGRPNLHTFPPCSINNNLLSHKECPKYSFQCYGIYPIIRSHYSQMYIPLFPFTSNLLIYQAILHNACQVSSQSKSYLWQSPPHYLAMAPH